MCAPRANAAEDTATRFASAGCAVLAGHTVARLAWGQARHRPARCADRMPVLPHSPRAPRLRLRRRQRRLDAGRASLLAVARASSPSMRELDAFVPGASVQAERSAGACQGHLSARGLPGGRLGRRRRRGGSARASAASRRARHGRGSARRASCRDAKGRRRGRAFVDLQNDVTAKDIGLAVREGFQAIEHVKRYTTTGMATDQGKTSNMTALGLAAEALDKPVPRSARRRSGRPTRR